MVIHRYDLPSAKPAKSKTGVRDRLASYAQQSGAFRSTRARSRLAAPLSAGALAAVVPLAASVETANAQCFSSFGVSATQNSSATFPVGATKNLFLSVNRLGTFIAEINVGVVGGTGDDGFQVGTNQVLALPSSTIVGPGSFGTGRLCQVFQTSYTGAFCPTYTVGAYAGFQISGRTGWLRLRLNSANAAFASLTVLTGFSNPIADNPTHIPTCASTNLPVELVTFGAIVHDDAVRLTWETASELDNAGFEIQRAKTNGVFQKVAFVDGHGTTNDPQSYAFSDTEVETNVRYRYRLKQIDLDGTTSFSDIVEVFTEEAGSVALSEFYPNPTSNGRARLNINVAEPTQASVEVYDVQGAIVASSTKVLNAGQNAIRIETSDLAAGNHFAKIEVDGRVMYRQFVVQ